MIRLRLFGKCAPWGLCVLLCAAIPLCAAGIFAKSVYCACAHTGTVFIAAERWFAAAVLLACAVLDVLVFAEVIYPEEDKVDECVKYTSPVFVCMLIRGIVVCVKRTPGVTGDVVSALACIAFAVFIVMEGVARIKDRRFHLLTGKNGLIAKSKRERALCRIALHDKESISRQQAVRRLQALSGEKGLLTDDAPVVYKGLTVRGVFGKIALTDPDAMTRQCALRSAGEDVVEQVARHDKNARCRERALDYVTNTTVLIKAVYDPAENVSCAALQRLDDKADKKALEEIALAVGSVCEKTREKAVCRVTNADVLAKAAYDPAENVSYAAVQRITDEKTLEEIALAGGRVCAKARGEAVRRVRDQAILERLVVEDTDRRVWGAAMRQMQNLDLRFSEYTALQAFVDAVTAELKKIDGPAEFAQFRNRSGQLDKLKTLYEWLCWDSQVRFKRVNVPTDHEDRIENHMDYDGYYDHAQHSDYSGPHEDESEHFDEIRYTLLP